jgi:hypothetical protein
MKCLFLLFIIPSISLYAHGDRDKEYSEVIDLGRINVMIENKYCEVNLPYYKDFGIDRIPAKDSTSIRLYRLIGDGKLIRPKKQYFSNNEAISRKHETSVDINGNDYYLKMIWFILGAYRTESNLKQGLFYESLIEKDVYSELYNIPYGVKEIYLTYSIKFPNNSMETEKKIVRWELQWP